MGREEGRDGSKGGARRRRSGKGEGVGRLALGGVVGEDANLVGLKIDDEGGKGGEGIGAAGAIDGEGGIGRVACMGEKARDRKSAPRNLTISSTHSGLSCW